MNFTEFIRKTDNITGNMPSENLAAFLHDCARIVLGYKREEFLERLISFSDFSTGMKNMMTGTVKEKNFSTKIRKISA